MVAALGQSARHLRFGWNTLGQSGKLFGRLVGVGITMTTAVADFLVLGLSSILTGHVPKAGQSRNDPIL